MRSRLIAVTLSLCFVLFGCSGKSANSSDANSASGNAASPSSSGSGASGGSSAASGGSTSSSAKKVAESKPVVVPVGTVLTVNLGEALGSKISQPGQTFSATLAQPVTVGGETVLAKGATASGTVVDAKPLGRFKGGAVLQLKLNSVSDLPVETSSVVRTATGKGNALPPWSAEALDWVRSSEVLLEAVKARRLVRLPAQALVPRHGLYRQQRNYVTGRNCCQLQTRAAVGDQKIICVWSVIVTLGGPNSPRVYYLKAR